MFYYYTIVSLLCTITCFLIGAFVFLKNPKREENLRFFMMSVFVAIWSAGFFILFSSTKKEMASLGCYICHLGSIFISITCLHWILVVLNLQKKLKKTITAGYSYAFILFIIELVTFYPLLVEDIVKKPLVLGYYPGWYFKATFFYFIFHILPQFVFVGYSFYLLWKNIIISTGIQRQRLKFLFTGILTGWLCGWTIFLLAYNIPFPPVFVPLTFTYVIFIGYAILKYQLFDIKTIIHKTFLWLLLSLSLFIPIGLVFYLLADWLRGLNLFDLILVIFLFIYIFSFFKSKLQPTIDHFFRRRKYDYRQALLTAHEKIAIVQNIDQTAKKFLNSLDETLYPQQCFLLIKTESKYILKEKIGRVNKNLSLSLDHPLSIFLEEKKRLIEKDQLSINPEYQIIKQKALRWFNANQAEIIFPIILIQEYGEEILALAVLGKKSSLKSYIADDLKLLERLGRQTGISFYNALHYGELEKEKKKVENIISLLSDGLILLDKEEKILHINEQAKKILNLEERKENRLINKKITKEKLKNYPHLFQLISFLKKQNAKQGKLSENLSLKDQFARDQIFEITLSYLKELKGTLVILHNITREKLIDTMKSEFISIAAHQLRTPLSAIKWSIKMILDKDAGEINEEQEELLEKGYQSNERMIKLVNDMLNVSRIEEGRFLYKFSQQSLEMLIREAISIYTQIANQKKVKIIFNKPIKSLPKTEVDAEKLLLAIQNLIENAVRYSPKNSKVIIIAKYDKINKKIGTCIKDVGIGIPKVQQDRVFSKFFRGDNVVKKQTEGTGLGLFITKNIIEAHKGKIWFESEENKGTKFCFALPIMDIK